MIITDTTTAEESETDDRRERCHILTTGHSFIRSFIQAISIAPLQVIYCSEALPSQHGYCVRVSRRMPQATASEGLVPGPYGIQTHNPSDKRRWICQWPTRPHKL